MSSFLLDPSTRSELRTSFCDGCKRLNKRAGNFPYTRFCLCVGYKMETFTLISDYRFRVVNPGDSAKRARLGRRAGFSLHVNARLNPAFFILGLALLHINTTKFSPQFPWVFNWNCSCNRPFCSSGDQPETPNYKVFPLRIAKRSIIMSVSFKLGCFKISITTMSKLTYCTYLLFVIKLNVFFLFFFKTRQLYMMNFLQFDRDHTTITDMQMVKVAGWVFCNHS